MKLFHRTFELILPAAYKLQRTFEYSYMCVFSVSVCCFQDDLEVSSKEHLCICTLSCVYMFFVAEEDKALKHRSSILAGATYAGTM